MHGEGESETGEAGVNGVVASLPVVPVTQKCGLVAGRTRVPRGRPVAAKRASVTGAITAKGILSIR